MIVRSSGDTARLCGALSTGTPVDRLVCMSMADTRFDSWSGLKARTSVGEKATEWAFGGMSTVATRAPVFGLYTSMRCWLWIGTHSLPSGATDRAYGWGPVRTYRTDLVAASTMATPLPEKSSSYVETYTRVPSRLTATNRGVCASRTELFFFNDTATTERTCE